MGRLFVVVAMLLLAACTGAPATPSPSPSPTHVPSGPLMTVAINGGLCQMAPCGTFLTVERDGRVHQAVKPPNEMGTVAPAELAALEAAINTTDFTLLKSARFTGQCPLAFDGTEVVFAFNGPEKMEEIGSCDVAIDWSDPLFVAALAAVEPFVDVPR